MNQYLRSIKSSLCLLSILILIVLSACQKTSDSSAADIAALKESVTALQKTTDSLSKALAATNNNVANLSSKVDSIKSQIVIIQNQITLLNSQLTITNTNITTINAQIVVLNQQYAALLAQLNAILAQLAVTPSSLTSGLVAYYPFTGNANDSSGNGNNGTVYSALLASDRFGKTNSSYSFNGTRGYPIDPDPVQEIVVSNKIIKLSNDYSISIWMNSTNIAKNQQCLFNSINHTGFAVEYNNNNVPSKLMYGVGSSITFWDLIYASGNSTNFQNNAWRHIAFIKSGTNYSLYLDGKLEGSSVVSQSSNYTESVGLRIGSIGGGYEVFKGSLDDVRIYNRALTQTEITYLANH